MSKVERTKEKDFIAQGNMRTRLWPALLLGFAWFFPYRKVRVWFHKKRGVKVGKNVEIGYFCIIGNVHPEMITLEDDCVITAKTTILEHDNALYYTGRGDVVSAPVRVKKGAFVGIGSTIMPGVTIGERSIVACHSFVTKDVPDCTLVGGCPAKLLKEYND